MKRNENIKNTHIFGVLNKDTKSDSEKHIAKIICANLEFAININCTKCVLLKIYFKHNNTNTEK